MSYDELAFHLLDSASFGAFARLPVDWTPSKAALQANIAAITDTTWQAINTQLVDAAGEAGVERATMWRIDSPIHEPSDSSLLLYGVRVMRRLLEAGQALPDAPTLFWHDHMRRAKKRARTIQYTRGKDKKKPLYRDLIKLTQATLGYLENSAERLSTSGTEVFALMAWRAKVEQ